MDGHMSTRFFLILQSPMNMLTQIIFQMVESGQIIGLRGALQEILLGKNLKLKDTLIMSGKTVK